MGGTMIQWYPGHMKKARDEITEAVNRIDVIIEILDARLPLSSSNPVLHEIRGNKPCIRILNKSDLADPAVTEKWVAALERDLSIRAIPIVAHEKAFIKKLPHICSSLTENRLRRPVRALLSEFRT